ncbi:MAG: hypothetical protein JWM36_3012 [Hyphomicrobiales bacterium]|nr:hypothetical protein [Hyphomicrobiales bacterium]
MKKIFTLLALLVPGALSTVAVAAPSLNNEAVCSQPGYSQDQRCVGQ